MIKVILADDHLLMREGLRHILSREGDIVIVGEATNGREVRDLVQRQQADVVIMDISMPDLNGIEATRQITAASPETRILAVSAFSDRRYVMGMLDAGASGYLVKDTAGEELVRAIRAVMRGKKYLCAEIAGEVVNSRIKPVEDVVAQGRPLSDREREILQMLAEGRGTKEIATILDISTRTAETHRRNIMAKLDLHNLADLTRYAIREGIVDPDK